MTDSNLNILSEKLSRVESWAKLHSTDYEPHAAATANNSGIVPQSVAIQLYTNGLRYSGLTTSATGKYVLEKMSFGRYIGVVGNFSDYPTGFGDTVTDYVAVTIEGFGSTEVQPNSDNYYGSNTITDSGLYRHITIVNISQGKKIEKYIGLIYNSTKNYGWVSPNYWATGTSTVGSGTIKARRFFDGGGLDIEVVVDVSGLNIKNGAGTVIIGNLPSGYTLDPNRPTYFTAFGQNTTTNDNFPVMTYIRGNGQEIKVFANQDIDSVKFRIKSSSFTF